MTLDFCTIPGRRGNGVPQVPFGTWESTDSKERIHAVKDRAVLQFP
jgi:hypothetical protein